MTSVPNLRLQLNGSKAIAICLVVFTIFSCKAPRQAIGKPPESPKPPVTAAEEQVKQYDPVKDTVVLIPRNAIKADTIMWSEENTPPIVTDEIVRSDKPPKKDRAEIAILIPFNAANAPLFSESRDPKLNRFIQYYAGMKMAIDKIDSRGLPVSVHSFDVDAAAGSISRLTSSTDIKNADVIVGPYEKEDLEEIAAFGLKHEIMVVSPWLPAFTGETLNPFLIQLFPGLNTHAEAIAGFIQVEMPEKKVYVVSRDNPVERNRMQLFSRINALHGEELVIKDISPDLINTDLHSLLSDDVGTVFIMPYFSKTDEAFVSSFMRKLHADKDTREAIVFGLPQWIGYTNINSNYLESLSLHLSISSFIDVSSPDYQNFRAGFFNTFHCVPDLNAFLGYDLMMWLAGSLTNSGQEGLIGQMNPSQYGLASGFDIRPIYKHDGAPQEKSNPLYYENKRIRILRYVDQDFIIVR